MYIEDVENRVFSFSPTTVCFQNLSKPRISWLVQCLFTDSFTHMVLKLDTENAEITTFNTVCWLLYYFGGVSGLTWMFYMCFREDVEPDGDLGEVEGATQGLPSRSSVQLQPPSPSTVMEMDKQGALLVSTYYNHLSIRLLIWRQLLHFCSFVPVLHKRIFCFVRMVIVCVTVVFHLPAFCPLCLCPFMFRAFIWSRHPEESLICRAQFQGRPRRKRTPRFLLKPWTCCSLTDTQVTADL